MGQNGKSIQVGPQCSVLLLPLDLAMVIAAGLGEGVARALVVTGGLGREDGWKARPMVVVGVGGDLTSNGGPWPRELGSDD